MRHAAALLLLLVLTGCGEESEPRSESGTTDPSTTAASRSPQSPTAEEPTTTAQSSASSPRTSEQPEPGTEVVVSPSDFGPMLFDSAGQAIYLFDVETTDEPRCYDDCAVAWPPVVTEGEPVPGDGVRPELLGTTRRTDGTTQVTYGGHPLYFYAHEGPNEVKCHDVFLNGGTWYVVQPDGRPAP